MEFLKRFSDKSAEVRIAAIDAAKACYIAASSGNVAQNILSKATTSICGYYMRITMSKHPFHVDVLFLLAESLEGRLLDFDDKVRIDPLFILSQTLLFSAMSCWLGPNCSPFPLRTKYICVICARMLYIAYSDYNIHLARSDDVYGPTQ